MIKIWKTIKRIYDKCLLLNDTLDSIIIKIGD